MISTTGEPISKSGFLVFNSTQGTFLHFPCTTSSCLCISKPVVSKLVPLLFNTTYRNLTIQALCGLPASFLGGLTVNLLGIGQKGTGCAVCLCTSLFLFLFTQAKTRAAVLGFSCGVAFFQNLTLGLLYSYTPELFPAPTHGTGNGLAMLFNRSSVLGATLIGAYVGLTTSVPIWVSAALFAVAGLMFLTLPYESCGRTTS